MFDRRRFLAGALATGMTLGWKERSPSAAIRPFVVDAHCHTFNVLDLPIAGFVEAYAVGTLHLPLLGFMRSLVREFERALVFVARASAADRVGALGTAHAAFERLTGALPADLAWAGEFGSAIDTATKTNDQIAEQLARQYADVDLFLPSMVDFDGWTPEGTRPPERDLDQRIAQHESMALKFMKGDNGKARFHPFVSFNPRREGGLDKVKDAIEKRGFVGVKLYPPCGFSASGNASLRSLQDGAELDQRLDELFHYCEGAAVPILAHTGASNAFRRGAEFRASPLTWEDTLKKYPKLRVDLGHFGQDRGVVDGCPNVECLVWSMEIASLMDRYDHVYADLADSPLGFDPSYEQRYLPLLTDVFAKHGATKLRVLYGSDWWMNELAPNPEHYYDMIRGFFSKNFPDGLNDVMGASALRFLGFRQDDGSVNDCNPNWQRLSRYYEANHCPKPEWLGGPSHKAPLFCLTKGG